MVVVHTYFCYQHDVSSSITLASTAKLAKDVLYQAPIVYIASSSEKIETKYSILLRQYARRKRKRLRAEVEQ